MKLVGIGKAMEWALLALTLSAQEAERWGLVTRVAPRDHLENETAELANQLAAGPNLGPGLDQGRIGSGMGRAARNRISLSRPRSHGVAALRRFQGGGACFC